MAAAIEASKQVTAEVAAAASGAALPTDEPAIETARSRANGKRKADQQSEPRGSSGVTKRPAAGAPGSSASDGAAAVEEVAAEAAHAADLPEDEWGGHGHGAAELDSYSAEAIDTFFLAMAGGPFLAGLSSSSADGNTFVRLLETARDACRVTKQTLDAAAEARAAHWVAALEEHGALLGWNVDDEEERGDKDALASVAAGGSGTPAVHTAAVWGDSSSANAHPMHGGPAEEGEDAALAEDGNFDACDICGLGGLLICCEACPSAFHSACLGDRAPPEDDEEDKAWFCPPCATSLGITAM